MRPRRRLSILLAMLSVGVGVYADFNPIDPPEPMVTRTLTVGVSPTAAGTATGDGKYAVGEVVQISTKANKDYTFRQWTLNGVPYATSMSLSYTMGDSAVVFIAQYDYTPPVVPIEPFDPTNPPEPYLSQWVEVTADPLAGGYTRGSGTYTSGQKTTIQVVPYTQYAFRGWTLNGYPYNEQNTSFTYTVGDSSALFVAKLVEKHLITVRTYPRSAGVSRMTYGTTTTDNEILPPDEAVTLTTTGNTDYVFRYWMLNGQVYDTQTTAAYTMGDSTVAFTAVYDYIGHGDTTMFSPTNPPEPLLYEDVTIKVISADTTKGTASGSGTFHFAAFDTIVATPLPGYVFRYWHDGNTNATRVVVAEQDTLYIAYFGNDTTQIDTTICYGETLQVGDTLLTQSGHREFYTLRPDGLLTWNIVDLTILGPQSSSMYVSICQGDTFTYEGGSYATAGVYIDTLQNYIGCDSVVTLHLTINPVYDYTIVAGICASERYEENNFSADTTGVYVQYLTSIHGCDSIVRLDLTVHPEYDSTIVARICQGNAYQENGFDETEAGEYTLRLQSEFGCDSVIHLQLSVDSVETTYYYDTICQGDSYTWRNEVYAPMQDTICYDKEASTVNSCGYVLHELHLTVHPQLQIAWSEQSLQLCHNTETPTLEYTTIAGSPMSYTLSLRDTVTEQVAVWNDRDIRQGVTLPLLPDTMRPGYYQLTITVQDSFCQPFSTTLPVEIHYAGDSLLTQRWNDLLAVRKTFYDRMGGFNAYQWYMDGQALTGETNSTLYRPDEGLDGHTYQVEVTRQSDGVTLICCPFSPTEQPTTVTLVVRPSVVETKAPVRVRTNQRGQLKAYNREGQKVVGDICLEQGENCIEAPSTPGLYMLTFVSDDGQQTVQKLLVY